VSKTLVPLRPHRHRWPDDSLAVMSLTERTRWRAFLPCGAMLMAADGRETHPSFEAAAQALAVLGFGPGRKETR
jgi:hypothetical protein